MLNGFLVYRRPKRLTSFPRYSEQYITDAELETLPGRTRDQVRRAAQNAQQIYGAPGQWGGEFLPVTNLSSKPFPLSPSHYLQAWADTTLHPREGAAAETDCLVQPGSGTACA
jgi:hypothetical protein